jgi:THO complex subunit 2
LLLERIESSVLANSKIIADEKPFVKRMIRFNTSMLYKQTKFNLLREESEGYSKLLCALTEHLVQPLDIYWTVEKKSHHELSQQRTEHIERNTTLVVKNIKSVIGFFDLDPNRVLDIILDVFISNVTDHWYGNHTNYIGANLIF